MVSINVVIIDEMIMVKGNISSFPKNVTSTASNCVTMMEYASTIINVPNNTVCSISTIGDSMSTINDNKGIIDDNTGTIDDSKGTIDDNVRVSNDINVITKDSISTSVSNKLIMCINKCGNLYYVTSVFSSKALDTTSLDINWVVHYKGHCGVVICGVHG